jgi:hypothetical protein
LWKRGRLAEEGEALTISLLLGKENTAGRGAPLHPQLTNDA